MKNHSTFWCNAFFRRMPLLLKRATHCLAFVFGLGLFLFAASGTAQAQATLNMKDGTTTVSGTISFYDSQGGATGAESYWNSYYRHNEEFVHTFKPGTSGYKVQVAFNTFTAYGPDPSDPNGSTGTSLGSWSVRLNDDFLYVYDGDRVDDTKLIAAYTGNSEQAFTIVATGSTGALTFVFKSNGQYREEGWAATVTQVETATAQAPFIRRATCENEIEMLPTTLKAKIYYTTDGSTPTTFSTQYRRPIDFPSGSLTVKAISTLSTGGTASAVASVTFDASEHLTNPGNPTVSDLSADNTVTMTAPAVPAGLNETYVVRYTMTTDGSTPSDPSLYNSTEYTGPITITTPNTKIKARTFAKSCDNWYSGIVTKTFSTLTCPKPTIILNETEQTITFDGNYNLSYTTDGSVPTTSNGTQVSGSGSATQTVTLSGLALGTNVKAITYKDGYTASAVASEFYSTGNTMTSSVVFLDDREDHSWSYYTEESPIHSLNPADVKITYYGNGTGTVSSTTTATPANDSWTGNATGTMVGVNAGETQNTFVYLKTLERENENGDGNLPYTMIANPFQVRPIYTSSSKGEDNNEPITININNVASVEPETQAIPEPIFIDPVMPEETEYFSRGSRSGTHTENFNSYGVGTRPSTWTYSSSGGLHTSDPIIAGDNYINGSNYMQFNADGTIITAGTSMAVMPYYANIESITFTYRVTSATLQVGWYNGSSYQAGGQISLTSGTATTYTLNSSNAATLLNNVNSSENGRIAFRLYATGTLERSAGIDNVIVTFTPKAPAFNYADGTIFTGTSAPITISRKDPSTVTYYIATTADDNSEPNISTWSRFTGNSYSATVSADKPRLRAFAYHEASGTFSAVTDATYQFELQAPTFNPDGGTYQNQTTQQVVITGPNAGTTVYYTLDGSTPTTSSPNHFDVPNNNTTHTVTMGDVAGGPYLQLRAIAVATDFTSLTSAEKAATYTFTLGNPTISPAGGVYFVSGNFNVTITGHGGTIHYTTDGSDPTEESPVYNSTLSLPTNISEVTVKAKAFSALGQSVVVSQTYIFKQDVSSDDQYRGFYAWRVKSKSAGLTIKSKDGNTTYGVGDRIDADADIVFETSNEYGNEVEFEALWARAYVVNASVNGANNITAQSVGRERNFVVLTTANTYAYGGNNGRRIGNTNYDATISNYYPHGKVGNANAGMSGNITLAANVKFESTNLPDNSTLNANAKNLTVGRGVSGTVTNLYGLNGNYTSGNGFTLRIESGTYANLYFMNNTANTQMTSGKLVAVLGSDYDRANNEDNSNLRVTTDIAVGYNSTLGTSSTIGQERFHCTVKSGNFDLGTANYGGSYQFYMSIYNGSPKAYGKRTCVIEGGEFSDIAGGMESDVNPGTGVRLFDLRMKGGQSNSVVYGAAQKSGAQGDRRMVFTGGTVKGWIAGGANGTETTGGKLDGNTYVYFGGNARCDSDGSATTFGPGDATGGNIFGAGSGNSGADPATATVGEVNNSTVVIADNAYVERNVYGGGNYGYVCAGTNHGSDIHILGGTVNGSVFGGSNMQKGQIVNITMKDGTVTGNLYGGSNTNGTVNGLATINVSGGSVTNVFGGGYGANTVMAAGTKVTIDGGQIGNETSGGNVYGGGALGTVTGQTNVTFNEGSVNDVFGAGQGASGQPATISGQTFVNINGGQVNGAVYGGGEMGDVVVGIETPATYTYTDYTFESNMTGWTSNPTTNGWSRQNSNPHGGNYALRAQNSSTTSKWLRTTNKVPLGGTFSFWLRGSGNNNAQAGYGRVEVLVSTTDYNTSSFTVIQTGIATTNTYTQYTFDLSAYEGQEGYIAIRHYSSNNNGYVHVDDVHVRTAIASPAVNYAQASTVTVTGGTVEGDVYGGGKMGKTTGNGIVTVNGGLIKLNVFGGALGSHGSVYFAGHKTVNILKGQIKGSVYGGSHDANDALTFSPGTFDSSNETTTSSNINICGGQIEQHVYSAGYYGNTFGSVYSFIGLKAIEEAPNNNHDAMTAAGVSFNKSKLVIKGHVWAGGDWGTFSGGTFGGATITGNSNIYIDGLGYQSNDNNTTQEYYMKLKGSAMGCGTSADAGKGENNLFIRNFGDDLPNTGSDNDYSPFLASTEITSIQRWHKVRIENSHLQMVGQGRITSLDIAEKYALYSIDQQLLIANGSSLVMNSPSDELYQLYSLQSFSDFYNANSTENAIVAYNGLGAAGSDTDNKIRINNGGFLKVRYTNASNNILFGELKGFFHLMGDPQNSTDIYARPKQGKDTSNQIPTGSDNPLDGGFVSYVDEENTFTAGTLTSNAFADVTDAPGTAGEEETGVQVPYENHVTGSKGDSQYYRIWRFGGISHTVEAVLNAIADNSDFKYQTVTVDVKLPGWRDENNYYRFVREGSTPETYYTLIDYGFDVLTFNAANYQADNGGVPYETVSEEETESMEWMNFNGTNETTGLSVNDVNEGLDQIEENPNLNFGLVVKPSSGMTGDNHIICSEANNYLANQTFGCNDVNVTPTLSFELTFSNNLRSTRTNDPIIIPMVQCDSEGNVVDTVNIVLTIATSTDLTLGSEWDMYAIMDGNNTNTHEKAVLRVEIPKFEVYESGKEAKFYIKKAEFSPRIALNSSDYTVNNSVVVAYNYYTSNFDINKFGLTLMPIKSTVSSDTWRFITDHELDVAPGSGENLPASEFKIGENGGRSPVSLDLALYYNANYDIETYTGEKPIPMGVVVYTLEFDNFANGDENHVGTSEIRVNIYRKGHARCFYVDGVNGLDVLENGRGDNPNYAVNSINFLLNRCGYTPGDIIYIVNTVTTDNETTWNGSAFQNNVIVERYPGGHELSDATNAIPEGMFDNTAFTGTLVDVQGNLTINGVIVDGNKDVVDAEAPMFNVEAGGQLNLGNATTLQDNNNTNGDGGAVHVAYGGTLRMNEDATITGNVSEQGGGVFMDGTMIVSDHVQVTGNSTSTSTTNNSNVWLAPIANAGEDGRVIQVGTADNDGYGPLSDDALIGVHKEDWGHGVNGYMPIVSAESGTEENLDLPYDTQSVIVPDQTNYTLQHYNDPDYLYWTSTWITAVTSKPTGYNAQQIDTPEELAWAISVVNGENGQSAQPGTSFTLTGDIDMSEHMWVPIGEGTNAYTGTFNGNGHTVTGIGSTLGKDDMGMFGSTDGATIENLVVQTSINSNSDNTGTVIGNMNGGTLSNVEGVGILTSTNNTYNSLGGLVGTTTGTDPEIHSSFAVVSVEGTMNSVVGGLVGEHYGDLYNAYSNLVISDNNKTDEIGGLVGYNNGTVENCYSIVSDLSFPAFAYENHGDVNYCYAATESTSYVGSGSAPEGSGTYGVSSELEGGKYGYAHSDQQIEAENDYVVNGTLSYDNVNHRGVLTGLLATLNKWVDAPSHSGYSHWTRTLGSPINGDYPVLLIQPSGVCLGSKDGRVIDYKTNLNDMIQDYNDAENGGNIFLYGTKSNAINTDTEENVCVYIDENVGLLQAENNVIKARVAVTLDNSSVINGEPTFMEYDWHMFSTSLSDVSLGIEYGTPAAGVGFGHQIADGDITLTTAGYYPINTPFAGFDFYAYDEPSRHYINLKRDSDNHWHNTTGVQIHYNNEPTFTPGKGYMMAINATTMLMADGELNNAAQVVMPVNYSAGSNDYDEKVKGVNLIGNPYQSYLDIEAFMNGNTDKISDDAYYVIDADKKGYISRPYSGSNNELYAPQYIHPHQGFFVAVKEGTSQVTFTNGMRVATGSTDSYFRDEKVDYPLVNLICTDASGRRDLTTVEVNRPELGGARKLKNMRAGNASIYAYFADNGYQALFAPKGVREVPVRFNAFADGEFTITWSMFNGEFSYAHLIDNLTGVDIDLLQANEYRFEASTDDYSSRFRLVFEVIDNDITDNDSDTFAFFDGNSWVITGEGTLQLFDVNGRCLMNTNVEGVQSSVAMPNVAAGVYMFHLVNGDNVKVQKVVVR